MGAFFSFIYRTSKTRAALSEVQINPSEVEECTLQILASNEVWRWEQEGEAWLRRSEGVAWLCAGSFSFSIHFVSLGFRAEFLSWSNHAVLIELRAPPKILFEALIKVSDFFLFPFIQSLHKIADKNLVLDHFSGLAHTKYNWCYSGNWQSSHRNPHPPDGGYGRIRQALDPRCSFSSSIWLTLI